MPTLVATRNTAPELSVQRIAREMGLNFHTHRDDLPGTSDLVFYETRTAVFVHGCHWHGHACRPAPKMNIEFWERKHRANRERDARNIRELKARGWSVIVLWECETNDEERVAIELMAVV